LRWLITFTFLFFALHLAQAQTAADSAGIYSRDTVVSPLASEKFDIDGKKVSTDSTVAFGADKIIPGKDTSSVVFKKHSPAKAV
jgi:hypothetical protein